MFTWICPQCGKEVPPAYTDCPTCAERAAQGANPNTPPPNPAAQPSPPPAYAPPPQYEAPPRQSFQPQAPPPPPYPYPPQQQQAPPPGYWMPPPQRRNSMPTWLLTILVAAGTSAVIFGAIWFLSNRSQSKPSATVESPAAKPGLPTNPIQRNVEVSGIRFDEDRKNKSKTIVKYVLTNHSGMDLSGLAGNVTIWGSTRKSEEEAQGTFAFSTNLRPFESRELEAPLNTKLKIYELPDWQNVTTDVQITAPVMPGGSGGR